MRRTDIIILLHAIIAVLLNFLTIIGCYYVGIPPVVAGMISVVVILAYIYITTAIFPEHFQ